jgi:photosystem I P700 chlorophyll a apoprotein A2
MTEESLYQKIFCFTFWPASYYFPWTSGNLFHVAWQGNFEQWGQNPLSIRPIAHAIWDPHFVVSLQKRLPEVVLQDP